MNMCDVLLKYKHNESNNLECNQIAVMFKDPAIIKYDKNGGQTEYKDEC